jgi:hypothetical protein
MEGTPSSVPQILKMGSNDALPSKKGEHFLRDAV